MKAQKRLAAQVMKCSKKRVWFDPARLDEIKEGITKFDIRNLIKDGAIIEKPVKSTSRAGARRRIVQKRKGRLKGPSSRKGKRTARLPKKLAWMRKIRLMRKFLKELREKGIISRRDYRMLYLKAKGGFFRSKRHIKLFIEERGLANKK